VLQPPLESAKQRRNKGGLLSFDVCYFPQCRHQYWWQSVTHWLLR